MVFPFGVSIGDFLAVSQLIWNISTALSKNKGSKKDCEALLQTLSSLYNALSAAQAIILDASPAAVPRKEQSAVNGIVHEARMCKKLLEDFLKCTEKYRMSLLHGAVRGRLEMNGGRLAGACLRNEVWINLTETCTDISTP